MHEREIVWSLPTHLSICYKHGGVIGKPRDLRRYTALLQMMENSVIVESLSTVSDGKQLASVLKMVASHIPKPLLLHFDQKGVFNGDLQ